MTAVAQHAYYGSFGHRLAELGVAVLAGCVVWLIRDSLSRVGRTSSTRNNRRASTVLPARRAGDVRRVVDRDTPRTRRPLAGGTRGRLERRPDYLNGRGR